MNSWTLDFETMPIGPRPEHYPPKPVGLAYRTPNGDTGYITDPMEMGICLSSALHDVSRGCRVEFHNGKFDMHVATRWFDARFQDHPNQVDDTMIMAFLIDPYARTLGLKPLADQWLNWAQEEKDACVEWILDHKDDLPTFEWLNNGKRPSKSTAGAWLAWVPVEILGPYAIGDVERTHALATIWRKIIKEHGMKEAYDVEMAVLPMFMENEEKGMNLDTNRLSEDIGQYRIAFDYVEEWLRWRLNAQGLNIDADAEVAAVLETQGIVTDWTLTKSGAKSVSKKNLHPDQFNDPILASMLGYRNRLKTALTMFMEPWLAQALARPDGRISTDWNQVQGDQGGTKTGRPSTRNPNFLNISKTFEGKFDGYIHPEGFGLPPLPLVREYILPNEGEVILKRDFSGQELHVFGHFEHGELAAQYRKNPNLDVHNFVGEKVVALSGDPAWIEPAQRTPLKVINFQSIYGGGIPALMNELRWDEARTREFKNFHDKALPGRKILADQLGYIVRTGMAIRTYGGRLYSRPPFITRDGRPSPADYRLLNYLVQGSSADITKRAMINMKNDPDYKSFFMLQVYDEMNISCPVDCAPDQMEVLRRAMESVPLRTSLPTDGEYGFNWGSMKKITSNELEHLGGAT
jgi:DNA polymerase I-like protein with 3'-5' exonuclease and polymerase domains